jgi:hypothetical protein
VDLSIKYEHVIITGDLNINLFDKKKTSLLSTLHHVFSICNDSCPTYTASHFVPSQIDIIYSKTTHRVISFDHFDSTGISNHQSLLLQYNILPNKLKQETYTFRSYNSVDVVDLNKEAESIDWYYLYTNEDIDEKITCFINILSELLNKKIPIKSITLKHPPVPWINNNIISLMKDRNQFYKMYKFNTKKSCKNIAYNCYKQVNKSVKNAINIAKKNHFENKFKTCNSNKSRWQLLHSLGITKKSKNALNNELPGNISADSLNDYFLRHNSLEVLQLPDHFQAQATQFAFTDISIEECARAINHIKSNAAGPDGLTLQFYKLILNNIDNPIVNIINTSLQTGIYPANLKHMIVDPVPKTNNPKSVENYRPICRINVLSKIFSVIVNTQLTKYIEINNILNAHQSGFRNKHSCTTAALDLSESIHCSLANSKCVITVLLDFSNAFPSVNHNLLLQILESIGLNDTAMKWFASFLNGWTQSVHWNGEISTKKTINKGVFQGEGNSQLLFTIFINHISTYIKNSELRQFADDTIISLECNVNKLDIELCIAKINEDLANILRFCYEFGLSINSTKSQAIIISSKHNLKKIVYDELPPIKINNENISYVDSVKYLGFHFDREFSSIPHTNTISKKVYYALSQLSPLKYSIPTNTKLQLIKSLILPIFDYMDIIYHNYDAHGAVNYNNLLQKQFNSAIRFVYCLNYNDHITPKLIQSNLVPLKDRREMHIAAMIYKIINGHAPSYLDRLVKLNTNKTRSANKLIINKAQNNTHIKSMLISAPKIWNKIDEAVRNKNTIESFIATLKDIYISNIDKN